VDNGKKGKQACVLVFGGDVWVWWWCWRHMTSFFEHIFLFYIFFVILSSVCLSSSSAAASALSSIPIWHRAFSLVQTSIVFAMAHLLCA